MAYACTGYDTTEAIGNSDSVPGRLWHPKRVPGGGGGGGEGKGIRCAARGGEMTLHRAS